MHQKAEAIMSSALVDYGSSDEEGEENVAARVQDSPSPPTSASPATEGFTRDVAEPSGAATGLPDAAELLGVLPGPGISSRLATASSESSAKKRQEPNGSAHLSPPNKIARGNLPPLRIRPDTAGGILLPPQLRGRSNVVTDDLDKLFVRRQRNE